MPKRSAAEVLKTAGAVEQRFENITHCTGCASLLQGRIWRRMYELTGGVVLVVLCDACNAAVPSGSAVDATFKAALERTGELVKLPPQGRA